VKVNYKQRFILALASYTFLLIFFVLGGFWLLIEYIEEPVSDEFILPSNPQVLAAMKENEASERAIIKKQFQIYSNTQDLPSQINEYKDFGIYQLANEGLLVIGQHAQSKKKYYLLLGFVQETLFIEEELEDIILVVVATVFNTLLVIYLVLFMAKKLTLPVIELQKRVREIDIDSKQLPLLERDDEVGLLSSHFSDLIIKMREFAQRERDFTRFSSHELRTPITIIRGNLDLLAKTIPDSPFNQRILKRMDIATKRMNNLIEVFLWLGRADRNEDLFPTQVITTTSLHFLIEQITDALGEHEKALLTTQVDDFSCELKPVMLTMVLDNLIRNALKHGVDDISIIAHSNKITIENQTVVNTSFQQESNTESPLEGESIGLQIVERICLANNWELKITPQKQCFNVRITFN
jgi:signal transduction histidine kinase